MSTGIWERRIADTPIAVIDCETTGLSPGGDRIVEFSVVRLEPGTRPKLVFDTLINPRRPMAGTEIHGITDSDVRNAPAFSDVADDILRSIQGAVLAAYNVSFDMMFLRHELRQCDRYQPIPHVCLMYMRPLLGLGRRCSLLDACEDHGVSLASAHQAGSDALASAQLWTVYDRHIQEQRLATWMDLAQVKSYKFTESFGTSPISGRGGPLRCQAIKPRTGTTAAILDKPRDQRQPAAAPPPPPPPAPRPKDPIAEYWDAMVAVLADLSLDPIEIEYIAEKRKKLGLSVEQIRSVHAKVFGYAIDRLTADTALDDKEVRALRRLHECLRALGWAPGV